MIQDIGGDCLSLSEQFPVATSWSCSEGVQSCYAHRAGHCPIGNSSQGILGA